VHPQAWSWVEKYAAKVGSPVRVMDQGGQNVNGSIRELFPTATDWTAVDTHNGLGVDLVADCGDYVHPGCDLVTSTELLEHTPRGADIVKRAFESLKPGGYYIVTTAAPGREPHGAFGTVEVPPDQHYANIAPEQLHGWLKDAGFVDIVVDHETTELDDVRAWARRPNSLSIVTVAYKRPEKIHILLRSFLVQTSTNWTMHIIHDGPDDEIKTILASYAEQWPQHFTYEFTDKRYNDFGHSLREMGIYKATGRYLLITNDDNYYVPIFVERVLGAFARTNCDGVFVDMLHNEVNAGYHKGLPYNFFDTKPLYGWADIGCVVIKTDVAKQIGWRNKSHSGDGVYIEDAGMTPGFKWTKIPQILFVHN
jgi:Glycosyl transferase family 2